MSGECGKKWWIVVPLMVLAAGCAAGSRGSLGTRSAGGPAGVGEPTIPVPLHTDSSAVSAPSSGDTAFGELLEMLADSPGGATADSQPLVSEGNRELMDALQGQRLATVETERGVVVTLPDVLFEFGSSDLTFGAKRKIRGIADTVLHLAGGRRIAVEGHTDSIGAELYNQALSERRAEAVARQLQVGGVPEALLSSKGFGEAYPVAANEYPDGADNPAGRAKNRRVEIVIEN